ncbi:RIP metalloprotease RseP [Bordetella trematum]|uniref:Zinc metalloprotease n=1 Tax=Bordetella trematum TaxID=123899 RepID=A0A157JSU3_9BORD|nr:RIP metalloprotease RseP [Bordetella trematum]AZR94196.1 RIP metalloprotease RseP [Bordetella trematum]NNH20445.1 RIP metalloprotease RseP [Bordetella trematum]SAH75453.1 inner membrane protease [Bordetella trematum]SAI72800.1 inner membrane protease [Bordetella trematum]SUV97618.1 inner membrane protease [Bordetella trematum]
MIFTLLAFVIALGTLITFHELGHYWVARLCGVRVLRFSVGFGRVLLRRRDRHGTEWAVSAIPLGGYVKMQDEPPAGATPAQVAESFNAKSVWQRFAIVAAGPVFNLILAVVLYAGLGMAGTEVPAPVLGQPAAGTPAQQAGVRAGDIIEDIDGRPVLSWTEARWRLFERLSSDQPVSLTLKDADGARRDLTLALPAGLRLDPSQADPVQVIGLRLQQARPVVRKVIEGGVGEAAGLQPGDLILSAAGREVPNADALVQAIQQHAGEPLALVLSRDGTPINLTLTPRAETVDGRRIGRVGVEIGGQVPMVVERFGPVDSLWRGVERTWDTAWLSLRMMGRMVMGEVSLRNISGPVTIADYAGQTARIGLEAYIAYLALISISLGVLNLLPIPMLDGGHLLYYLVEIVRGRPLSDRWVDIGQRAGIGLLACLMGLALFNDLTRLFT